MQEEEGVFVAAAVASRKVSMFALDAEKPRLDIGQGRAGPA